ncbi:MAG: riboflavin biosynthesis protein RibF [Henriciella sp.]|nr:riboflavin biosynthesis protein RibF [Henriciella sp.]
MLPVTAHYKDVPAAMRGFTVALGNFDGVHAGHRAVINAAQAAGGPLGVATFEPPPRAFFRPDDPPFRIYRPARRNARLAELGAKAIYELPFNGDMAAMTDEEFAREVLFDGLGAKHVTVGFDFRFGRGRMGDAARLSSLGRALGFGVSVVDKIETLGTKASSTAIREALIAGEPEKAAGILGHDWMIDGVVEAGEKRGRELGFPTANLHLGELLHPRHGVYAVRVRIGGETGWRSGVANFGRTPTTGLRDPLLEAFIFDFDGDIYGRTLEVALVAYLRPELKFEALDDMVAQMRRDTADARAALAG